MGNLSDASEQGESHPWSMPEDLDRCPGYKIGARMRDSDDGIGWVLVGVDEFQAARAWLRERVEVTDWFFSEDREAFWISFRSKQA